MAGLIESIPNVSEGRRRSLVDDMADAIRATGVRLLDQHTSAAHHRSVYTFAGTAALVEAAVLALVSRAVTDIDLRSHQGEHPRIGAVDVIPFVPLTEATMDDCVALARAVGAEIARRFELPVYLYEAAASAPERRSLEAIRRGGFEGLTARMQDPAWAPDFGPSRPHPSAGACVVGARRPLIAFNVNLDSDRLDVAQRIARSIRQSSGGLPAVKALGLRIADGGFVQVSMNLTDYQQTSMRTVFDAVAHAAAAEGIVIRESELVGLVPAAALPPSPETDLRLRDFRAEQVLEHWI